MTGGLPGPLLIGGGGPGREFIGQGTGGPGGQRPTHPGGAGGPGPGRERGGPGQPDGGGAGLLDGKGRGGSEMGHMCIVMLSPG